ncbi:MAG: M20 family metallopeptidase [Candidatus Omnitrophica bacterium]|nr:M20 family metallopeptidase [Candidatus Omnitrophota bacterium]
MADKNHLIKLTQSLIRIRSENPPGDEYKIACFVKKFFRGLGLKPKIYEFKKSRSNVIVILEGRNNRKNLLVTPHLDTVPAGASWGISPFAGVLRDNLIYGRGASDDKGNLAVLMEAIRSIIIQKKVLGYNLIFAATADEEAGSQYGLLPLLSKGILKPQAALILDADSFKIIVVQKGLLHIKVKIKGKSAHGAYPWEGISAIDIALKALSSIKSEKFVYKKNPYLRPPTVNIGTISGGDKVNVVSDWCEFELDFRFLPGMSASGIIRQIKRIIGKYSKKFNLEIMAEQMPSEVNPCHPLVKELKRSMRKHKIRPRVSGSEGATVLTFFQERNIPAVATGFGSSGCAHSSREYARVDYLCRGAEILEDFFSNFKFDPL